MIKQKLLLLAFAMVGIGSFIYYKQASQASNQITDFIPDNTLVLLETNEISTVKNAVIPRIPLLTNASSQYQILKSIGFSQKEIDLLTLKKTLYFALLPEGKDQLAFVNYLPLNADNEDFIEKLNSLSHNNTGKRIIPHTTQGYKVLEVIDERAKLLFAYIIQDNFLIFSSSNLALEESVLHTKNNWTKSLQFKNIDLKLDTIFTKTHFNKISINRFLKDVSVKNSTNLSSIFPESFEWLKPNVDAIEATSTNLDANLFEGQKSLSLQGLNMIPNHCSYSLMMSFSNRDKLINLIKKDLENDKKISLLREKLYDKFEVSFDNIYNELIDGINLCSFDNSDQSLQNKVLIIRQKELLKQLNIIANKVASVSENDVFSVEYGSFLITSLGIKEFPMMLLGETFTGFEECYFTKYNDYIILASSLPLMQEYLISISKGEVWSNSPKSKKILSHCLPANLTLIVENSKAIKGFQKILNNNWSDKITYYNNALSGVQAEILQLNSTTGRLVLLKNIDVSKNVQKISSRWIKLGEIKCESPSKPFYLVNPQNKNTQILVQGSDYKLNLFENGKRIWTYQLKSEIVGEIKSIKFSKSPSQELLVATNSKIFILIRNEKGFNITESKSFKGFNLENFIIFENENDKDKNLTFVSEMGNSFKFNKENLILTPNYIQKYAIQNLVPIPNIIFNDIQYAVMLQKSGKLILQNAKGKNANNFPLTISGIFNSPPLLEGDNNNVVIRLISEQGDLYKINLEGKILEKKQLFRPNNEVKFSMAIDERNTDWVLMRTDGKEVMVLDKNEKEMFTLKELNYGKKVLYYYNLGIAGKCFAVNNGYENYKFYDEGGTRIGQIDIESKFKPNLSYSDSYKKIIMNITKPSGIQTWSVKIR